MIQYVMWYDNLKTWKLFTVKYKITCQNTKNVTKFVHKNGNDNSYSICVTEWDFKVIIYYTRWRISLILQKC